VASAKKPWVAIIWFAAWGLFQAYAVSAVIAGTWQRPVAFPEKAYNALIYPDMVFIPIYLCAAFLLYRGHRLGPALALIAGGAVVYAMVYLLALAGFDAVQAIDGAFLAVTLIAILQVVWTDRGGAASPRTVGVTSTTNTFEG
jgi:hypothetical protein